MNSTRRPDGDSFIDFLLPEIKEIRRNRIKETFIDYPVSDHFKCYILAGVERVAIVVKVADQTH